MKSLPLISDIRESFASRIFIVISLFIITISILFTICFIRHQGEKMREILLKEGDLLANMLAFSGRLGVYAENEDLLKDPVEGIMRHNDVKRVAIFNFNGTLLKEEWNGAGGKLETEVGADKNSLPQSIQTLKALERPFHFQHDGALEIWAPVYIESPFISVKTPPLAGKPHQGHDQIIGFVNVTLGLDNLEKSLRDLLVKCCIAAFLFLLSALLVAYHASLALSNPLQRLAGRVSKITGEGAAEKLSIETNDEIGKLAGSFNYLVESLQKRTVEKELLEEQIRQMQKMEAVGALAGVAAHDFKNMLTAIIGYGVLLQNSMPKKNVLNIYVEKILAAADKAVNLARRMHAFGHIEVDSTPEKGTSVTVLLPLYSSTMESRKLEPLLMPKGKRETVLLAEDDRFVRKLARHILAKYDYHVIEAADGDEAVRIFQENSEKIDVLLLDVIMPNLNGYQVHQAIARLQPGIKTLYMSAVPSEIAKEEYLIGEGRHFITKPLLPGILLTKIREVLES